MKTLKLIFIIGFLALTSCDCEPVTQKYNTQTSAIIDIKDGVYFDNLESYQVMEVLKIGNMKYIIFGKTSYDGGVHVVNYTLDSLKVESLKK